MIKWRSVCKLFGVDLGNNFPFELNKVWVLQLLGEKKIVKADHSRLRFSLLNAFTLCL